MRVIKELVFDNCKASIFYMNQKYIIKFETGSLEQIYKISELDFIIKDLNDIEQIINETLLNEASKIFVQMNETFRTAMQNY